MMPEYRDRGELFRGHGESKSGWRLTHDAEIVETYQKGSPYLLSPNERVEEHQARRKANSRDSYRQPRARSPAYDDCDYKPAKTVSPTAAATVGTAVGNQVARRRHSMSPSQGTLTSYPCMQIRSDRYRPTSTSVLLRVRCRLRLLLGHLQQEVTQAQEG